MLVLARTGCQGLMPNGKEGLLDGKGRSNLFFSFLRDFLFVYLCPFPFLAAVFPSLGGLMCLFCLGPQSRLPDG